MSRREVNEVWKNYEKVSTIHSSGNEVYDLSSMQKRYKEVGMRWEAKAQIYSKCRARFQIKSQFPWVNSLSPGLLSILGEKFFNLCCQVIPI